ncbi:hypothetical protein N836_35760 [Leptolyngbya sp. Heron Island J]|uniref:hypothetical protein n=1 Tax=Leptolyngbya sp. Heron Island J TaxID=1385935 RepID=UPI0003B9CE65|nr:hypothetical protein [Leptolyngbya sp. Heron Island J]ESA37731.1 hypothetical protein N836_35760 [Leptolyngbya sp. Heron Island J]
MNKDSDARHSIADGTTSAGTGVTPEDIVKKIADWDRQDIEALVEHLRGLLSTAEIRQSLEELLERKVEPSPITEQGPEHGWVEQRTINGCGPYQYFRWWDGKVKRSKYLGKVKTAGGVA